MTESSSCQRGHPTLAKLQLSGSNKNLVSVPRFGLTPRLTGRLTVGHNMDLISTLVLCDTVESHHQATTSEDIAQ
jgi:hypothetical protein